MDHASNLNPATPASSKSSTHTQESQPDKAIYREMYDYLMALLQAMKRNRQLDERESLNDYYYALYDSNTQTNSPNAIAWYTSEITDLFHNTSPGSGVEDEAERVITGALTLIRSRCQSSFQICLRGTRSEALGDGDGRCLEGVSDGSGAQP